MKQVIFVGSTSYSGSTFFDMTLGNDPAGFSCGEVYAYFRPTRPHHINPQCGCGDENCRVWSQIKSKGVEHVYETIFSMFPHVEYIVDSSKDPFWIQEQSRRLRRQGILVKNILIWKTPVELAHSYKKRTELEDWEHSWVIYHRLYYTLISEWRAIRYRDYVQSPEILATVCDYLDIPYFAGKENYWSKTHHLLFGNDSARIHLNKGVLQTSEEAEVSSYHPIVTEKTYRKIYYRPINDPELEKYIKLRIQHSPYLSAIRELLESRDVSSDQTNFPQYLDLQLGYLAIELRRLKRRLLFQLGQLRYAH